MSGYLFEVFVGSSMKGLFEYCALYIFEVVGCRQLVEKGRLMLSLGEGGSKMKQIKLVAS